MMRIASNPAVAIAATAKIYKARYCCISANRPPAECLAIPHSVRCYIFRDSPRSSAIRGSEHVESRASERAAAG
jgi:hypothetical protein